MPVGESDPTSTPVEKTTPTPEETTPTPGAGSTPILEPIPFETTLPPVESPPEA